MARNSLFSITKFHSLFVTLSEEERQDFSRFLSIPSFTDSISQTLINLYFEIYQLEIQLGNDIHLTTGELWEKAFPGTDYNDSLLRKNLSLLTNQLAGFLAFAGMKRAKGQKALFLARELNRRNEQKNLNAQLNKARKNFASQEIWDSQDYLNAYFMAIEAYNVEFKKGKRANIAMFEQLVNFLNDFHEISLSEYYCQWVNLVQVYNWEGTVFPKMESIRQFQAQPELTQPATQLYLGIAEMLEAEDPVAEQLFSQLPPRLQEWENVLGANDRWNLHNYLFNFCIRRINQGQDQYLLELYKLYGQALANGSLIRNGYLPVWAYKNIATNFLKLARRGEIEIMEAQEFIESFRHRLPPEEQENIYQYCQAQMLFVMSDFKAARHLLEAEISQTDDLLKPDSRWLLLQCNYELGDFDLVLYQIDSFRRFLKRNKSLPIQRLERHLKRLALFKELTNILPKEMEKIRILRDKILKTLSLHDRTWLLEKLNALEK